MTKKSRPNQQGKEKTASSSSNRASKAIGFLILLTFFSLPFQFGKHFWPAFAFIHGLRIDYLSPTIYLSDISIFCLALMVLLTAFQNVQSVIRVIHDSVKRNAFVYGSSLFCFLFLIIGILRSTFPVEGWYGLAKAIEYSFFGIVVARHFSFSWHVKWLTVILAFSIIAETILGIWQLMLQHSVGNIFYFFGERTFGAETPGIANASINGNLLLRPYATFPHPNVFAAYLLIMSLILVLCTPYIFDQRVVWLRRLALTAAAIGIVLSLSRSVVVLGIIIGLILAAHHMHNKLANKVLGVLLICAVCASSLLMFTPVGIRLMHIHLGEESIVQREELTQFALQEFYMHPVVGVGLHNTLYSLPDYERLHRLQQLIQPVHSIYLLILSETGSLGFGYFIWFLIFAGQEVYKKKQITLTLLFGSVLILGCIDHYFLTLQQGQLLFTIVLAIVWSNDFQNLLKKKTKILTD